MLLCLLYLMESNPERADAVKKKPMAWLFPAYAAAESAMRRRGDSPSAKDVFHLEHICFENLHRKFSKRCGDQVT